MSDVIHLHNIAGFAEASEILSSKQNVTLEIYKDIRKAKSPLPSRLLSPSAKSLSATERLIQGLKSRYQDNCQKKLKTEEIIEKRMIQVIESVSEHEGVLMGTEMWNSLSLQEIDDPFRYYSDNQSGYRDFPFTVLSYGKRLEQGLALLSRIGAERFDSVSYPSLELAYANRDHLTRVLFRNAINMSWVNFTTVFKRDEIAIGNFLSTMNQWVILERVANGTYPEELLIVEDDVFTVPDFKRKFNILRKQLSSISWEVAFLGTCYEFKSSDAVTFNLFRARTSRCFNAVMMRKSAAVKILKYGACVDAFEPVDYLFNRYIQDLNLETFFVYPPLAYEKSKNHIEYPC